MSFVAKWTRLSKEQRRAWGMIAGVVTLGTVVKVCFCYGLWPGWFWYNLRLWLAFQTKKSRSPILIFLEVSFWPTRNDSSEKATLGWPRRNNSPIGVVGIENLVYPNSRPSKNDKWVNICASWKHMVGTRRWISKARKNVWDVRS